MPVSIPGDLWEQAKALYVQHGSSATQDFLNERNITISRSALQKRMERASVRYTGSTSGSYIETTRRCRNKQCINRFIPSSINHFFCSTVCGRSSDIWSPDEILAEEASLTPEANHLELARRAFGQKAAALRKVSHLSSHRDFLSYEMERLIKENPQVTIPVPTRYEGSPSGEPREVTVVCSDWQIGKLENGIGVKEVSDVRIPRLLDATHSIIAHYRRSGYSIERVNVSFVGDMVEGCKIYGGQSSYGLDTSVSAHRIIEQIYITAGLMAQVIADIAGDVEHVNVFSVPGNHGRTNGLHDFSDPRDNFDTLAARWARDKLVANAGTVEFNIGDEWFLDTVVASNTFVLSHGDAWNGSLSPSIDKLLPQWIVSDVFPRDTKALILGHRHSFASMEVNGVHVIQNGSLDGGSNWFTKRTGKSSKPCQVIFVSSAERPIEAVFPVYFN